MSDIDEPVGFPLSHDKSGRRLPDSLYDRLRAVEEAATRSGLETGEYLEKALLLERIARNLLRETVALGEAARLKRNVIYPLEEKFADPYDWIAVPREDFDKLRAALEAWEKKAGDLL